MAAERNMIMLLNFIVELLLLLGADCLCGGRGTLWRVVLGALLSAVHAGACLLPGFRFLGNLLWRLVGLAVMAMIAYGINKGGLQRGLVHLGLSLTWGMLAALLGKGNGLSAVLCAAMLIFLCVGAIRRRATQEQYATVSIFHGTSSITLTALVDTGNTLTDPVSGRPVLVADAMAAGQLLGLSRQQLDRPVETMVASGISGLRLIPYSAVGNPSGLLLGIKVDRLEINGRESDCLVAFAPQRIGQGKNFRALAGGMV